MKDGKNEGIWLTCQKMQCLSVQQLRECLETVKLSFSVSTGLQQRQSRVFLAKMEDILIRIFNENDQFFLAGDFNINIMDNSKCSVDFISLLYSFDMNPSISECTRISGTSASCIDNIFTNSQDFISEVLSC